MGKYILRSFKNFFIYEPIFFFLFIINVISSVIVIFFAVGLYHHIEQKKIDAEYGERYFWIDFYDYESDYEEKKEIVDNEEVTKRELTNLLCSLDESIVGDIEDIAYEVKFKEDVFGESLIDKVLTAEIQYKIYKGKPILSDAGKIIKKNGMLTDGRYFTMEEFEKKELLCLAPNFSLDYQTDISANQEAFKIAEKYRETKEGTFFVDGKEYQVIGHTRWFSPIPTVLFSTVDDNVFVTQCIFSFSHPITRASYEGISEAIRLKYGELAKISPLEIRSADAESFNKLLIAICVFGAMLSGIITSLLFQYIMAREKNTYVIYRLFGMSKTQIGIISLSTYFIYSFGALGCSALLYHFMVIPIMKSFFEYLPLSDNFHNYAVTGGIYLIVTLGLYLLFMRKKEKTI